MPAQASVLVFSTPLPWHVFGLILCAGFAALAAWKLLRPWPPRLRRGLPLALVWTLCAAAALQLQQVREVRLDSAQRQVLLRERGLVLPSAARQWTFEQVQAVRVVHAPQARPGPRALAGETGGAPRFELQLLVDDTAVALREFDTVQEAEAQARALATWGPWPARRHGYRLELGAQGGPAQRFRTATGKSGVAFDLQAWFRVVDAPGQDGDLGP